MENLVFEYNGSNNIKRNSFVGLNKIKDVEISFHLPKDDISKVTIDSEKNTDEKLWKSLLDRFFLINDIHADIQINDFGAKPSTITFRLNEALELACE